LEHYFEDNDWLYIFLEPALNGDLFEYSKREIIKEPLKRNLFKGICNALKYLHSKNILHRDIKPENILINEKLEPKLCDFGWSCYYDVKTPRYSVSGTP